MGSLRERNKAATKQRLQEAALDLAERVGVEAVSVEAICNAAGVSQRTFFNYFPFREAVFAVPPPPIPDAARDRFLEGDGPLLPALAELSCAQMAPLGDRLERFRLLQRISEEDPRIQAIQLKALQDSSLDLAGLIKVRIGSDRGSRSAEVMAVAVVAATVVGLKSWAAAPEADFAAVLRDSIDSLSLLAKPGGST